MRGCARFLPAVALVAVGILTGAASFFARDLPERISTIFSGSGNCAVCHKSDGHAFTASSGADVSPPELWRSTIMANAAKDPIWQAKVSTEVAAFPQLRQIIEDKCTTCHAPMGRTEAVAGGAATYSMDEMLADPLALDGVSCTVCHQIKDVRLGSDSSYSGNFVIENDRSVYGPYDNQLRGPMEATSGYVPKFAEHVTTSELCATCHTLFTPFLDNEGQIAGEFPEQVPYLEWRNSVYPDRDVQCQTCHMPDLHESIPISAIPPNSPDRNPIAQHHFVGANVTMLRLLRDNIDSLGITASEIQFDSTITRTVRQLQMVTVSMEATIDRDHDSLRIDVNLENLAGHKFPTGFPSRRAWLHVVVSDQDGQVVFESGRWDEETGVIQRGDESIYEPHHASISSETDVQIYESVMVDVDREATWTLLRGAGYVKDNRIPPSGFTTDHPDYEPAAIKGLAELDPDFNRNDGLEGSGSDLVTYRIAVPAAGEFAADVELLYQSFDPRFLEDLIGYATPETIAFAEYWVDADKSPTILQSLHVSTSATAVDLERPETDRAAVRLEQSFPNPFETATQLDFHLATSDVVVVDVVDVSGRVIRHLELGMRGAGRHRISWDGSDQAGFRLPAGIYLLRVSTTRGEASRIVIKGR